MVISSAVPQCYEIAGHWWTYYHGTERPGVLSLHHYPRPLQWNRYGGRAWREGLSLIRIGISGLRRKELPAMLSPPARLLPGEW